jgi:hypothetical protein
MVRFIVLNTFLYSLFTICATTRLDADDAGAYFILCSALLVVKDLFGHVEERLPLREGFPPSCVRVC